MHIGAWLTRQTQRKIIKAADKVTCQSQFIEVTFGTYTKYKSVHNSAVERVARLPPPGAPPQGLMPSVHKQPES